MGNKWELKFSSNIYRIPFTDTKPNYKQIYNIAKIIITINARSSFLRIPFLKLSRYVNV